MEKTIRKNIYSLTFLFILNLVCFCQNSNFNDKFLELKQKTKKYEDESTSYSKDITLLNKVMKRLSTDYSKVAVAQFIEDLNYQYCEKKLYPVDIYFSKKYKYNYDQKEMIKLPLDLILEFLNKQINQARIIRINKVKFNSLGKSGNIITSDFNNSFSDLTVYPEFSNKAKLKNILLTAILDKNKKQSLEWIWGKSLTNDAYYSTKLTLFQGTFSLYPIYRTYIGLDSFRNKNSWYFELAEFDHKKLVEENYLLNNFTEVNESADTKAQKLALELKKENPIVSLNDQKIEESTDKIDDNPETTLKVFQELLTAKGNEKVNLFYYKKDKEMHNLSKSIETTVSEITDMLFLNFRSNSVVKIVNIEELKLPLKLQSFLDTEITLVKNNDLEKIFQFAKPERSRLNMEGKKKLLKLLITLYLQSAITKDADIERSSLEIINQRKDKSQKYFANVVTIFGDQLTIFENYKRLADNQDFKDRKSWFYSLPVKK